MQLIQQVNPFIIIKKYLSNPSFLFLIVGNLYCIWYYQNHPGSFSTIVWIYWIQSVLIGLFNFIDLLTLRTFNPESFKISKGPMIEKGNGCLAFFFLIHYGIFHLVYMVFLLTDKGIRGVDKYFLLIGVAAFFAESLVSFFNHKKQEREGNINVGTLFILPYLRIIPMHMMIVLPKFFGIKASVLFLILKMGADILSYMVYHAVYNRTTNKSLDKKG